MASEFMRCAEDADIAEPASTRPASPERSTRRTNPNPDDSSRQQEPKVIYDAFVDAVARLERILDLETEMLRRHKTIGPSNFNHEKSLGLFELGRSMNALRGIDRLARRGFDSGTPLARLRTKLEENIACLEIHMNAVGEIASIIARVIMDHDSDGTYCATTDRVGKPR